MEGLNELDMSKIELVASEEYEYRCPFCDEILPKREMQFHVAIPLCMRIREEKAPSVIIEGVHPALQTNVPKIDIEYYGPMGIRKLLVYAIQRSTFGHPDAGKPIDLESFVDHSEVTEENIKIEEDLEGERVFRSKLSKVFGMLRTVVTGTTPNEKDESE